MRPFRLAYKRITNQRTILSAMTFQLIEQAFGFWFLKKNILYNQSCSHKQPMVKLILILSIELDALI
jgi:hypothetical protein